MDTVPIKDSPSFVRDKNSMAIINTNRQEQKRVLEQRAKRQQQLKDVENLKTDMVNIKDTLSKILQILEKNN